MRKRIFYVCAGILLLLLLLLLLSPPREMPEPILSETQPIVTVPMENGEHAEPPRNPPSMLQPLDLDEIQEEAEPPTVTLEGIVTNRRGAPVEGAEVFRHEPDKVPTATTDRRGHFKITELSADTGKLFVRHRNYMPKTVSIGTASRKGRVLEITLRRGATLTGTVTFLGRPLANHEVKFNTGMRFFGGYDEQTNTDASGVYEFTHLTPGFRSPEAFLRADDNEATPRKMSMDVILEDEQTTVANFDFCAWDASLEGQVLFNGAPLEAAWIHVVSRTLDNAEESFSAESDANGYYWFDALPAGLLEVQVSCTYNGTELHKKETTIDVRAGHVTTRDFSFAGTGVVTGYCLGLGEYDGDDESVLLIYPDISDMLAEGGWAEMGAILAEESSLGAEQKLAEDGSFRLEGLQAGTYTIMVMTMPHTLSFDHFSYVYRSVTVSDSQETHVTLGPDFVTEYVEGSGD